MEELKTWITGICTVSLIVAILKSMLPESIVGKTFNITASLVIVLMVILPVKNFDFGEIAFFAKKNEKAVEAKVEEVVSKTSEITDRIIEEKLCEYVSNKAELKTDEITVKCEDGEIKQITLHKDNVQAREFLKRDCGIADEKIKAGV